MQKLLISNLPPMRLSNKTTFSKCFNSLFEEADTVRIASGYVSVDALTELKSIAEMNNKNVILVIGMHFFEGMTKAQYQASNYLNKFLLKNSLGEVYITNTFKFHGKLYTFHKKNKIFSSIIGSSNLNGILDNHTTYETDVMLDNKDIITEINDFISQLLEKTCISISDWKPDSFIENNSILEGHENVQHCSVDEMMNIASTFTDIEFNIPIKPYEDSPKSNVNACFGKGRENKRKFVQPRHWYEVEIIVPKPITDNINYPKEDIITEYTDDCLKFNCKISGQNRKNFRSYDDLKILGKWIKGRLENAGILKIGDPLTKNMLSDYGRNSIKMKGTTDPKIWYLDFSSKNKL